MSDTYRNPNHSDRWTTPCCNRDIVGGPAGVRQCPDCKGMVLCTNEEIPVSVCTTNADEIEDWLSEVDA